MKVGETKDAGCACVRARMCACTSDRDMDREISLPQRVCPLALSHSIGNSALIWRGGVGGG